MKVLTNDNKFESIYNENISNAKGGVNMCDFLDTVEARGKAAGRSEGKIEGKIEGRIEGKIEGKAEIIQELLKARKMTVEQIADMLRLPVEKVKELAEMSLVTA